MPADYSYFKYSTDICIDIASAALKLQNNMRQKLSDNRIRSVLQFLYKFLI